MILGRRSKHGEPWRSEDEELLGRMVAQGFTTPVIAATLNRTREAVATKWRSICAKTGSKG